MFSTAPEMKQPDLQTNVSFSIREYRFTSSEETFGCAEKFRQAGFLASVAQSDPLTVVVHGMVGR